jgi:hypothetical protein
MSTRREFIQSVPAASAAFAVAGPEANNFTMGVGADSYLGHATGLIDGNLALSSWLQAMQILR